MISKEEEDAHILNCTLGSLTDMDHAAIDFLLLRAGKGDNEACTTALKTFLMKAKLTYGDELAQHMADIHKERKWWENHDKEKGRFVDARRKRLFWILRHFERWLPAGPFVDAMLAMPGLTIDRAFSIRRFRNGYRLLGLDKPLWQFVDELTDAELDGLLTHKVGIDI